MEQLAKVKGTALIKKTYGVRIKCLPSLLKTKTIGATDERKGSFHGAHWSYWKCLTPLMARNHV